MKNFLLITISLLIVIVGYCTYFTIIDIYFELFKLIFKQYTLFDNFPIWKKITYGIGSVVIVLTIWSYLLHKVYDPLFNYTEKLFKQK
jgi:hypothetical protein